MKLTFQIFFALILFSFSSAFALSPTPEKLPVVQPEIFVVGKSWVWNSVETTEAGPHFYSSEKYTVISKQGSVVLLEISSRYSETSEYAINHRILVDVQKCLGAYRNVLNYIGWSFRFFVLTSGRWDEVEFPSSTLAFEEKFNCDGHPRNNLSRMTILADGLDIFSESLFQQRRFGKDRSSWFFMDGNNSGVAAFKRMGDESFLPSYIMRFQGTQN